MSDRSDELTERRESRSPDEVLEETERLLSGTGGDAPADAAREPGAGESAAPLEDAGPQGSAGDLEAEPSATRSGSRLGRFAPAVELGELFSPKAFFALVLVLGAALFVGNAVIPFVGVGGFVAAFAAAFLVGLVTSKRRYLEVSTGGAVAGALAWLLTTDLIVVFAASIEMAVLAAGAGGLVVSALGYYFGRDLRAGLSRDIE